MITEMATLLANAAFQRWVWGMTLFLLGVSVAQASKAELIAVDNPSTVEVGHNANFYVKFSQDISSPVDVHLNSTNKEVGTLNKSNLMIQNEKVKVVVKTSAPGKTHIKATNQSTKLIKFSSLYVEVDVVHYLPLKIFNIIIGWVYFVAWSVSFYPQVYLNWKRKSVIGLNFDFLAYNITGFLFYGCFNIGMFWIPKVKDEYFKKHPHGVNPVQLNDVVFTIHAVFITLVTIFQCFIYERGEQRISNVCRFLVGGTWLFAIISLIVTTSHKISWLTYLYYFSYIKIGVTLIKYIPQAWMNFTRRSTLGWSIGNVLLDFTGGSLSLLQEVLIAYNHDDWTSIIGNLVKFGLGLFSMMFDVLFMVQHYCLYGPSKGAPYQNIDGPTKEILRV